MTLKAELAVRLESEPADHSAAIPHDIEGIFFNGVRGIITRGKFAVIISYIYIYLSETIDISDSHHTRLFLNLV